MSHRNGCNAQEVIWLATISAPVFVRHAVFGPEQHTYAMGVFSVSAICTVLGRSSLFMLISVEVMISPDHLDNT